MKTLYITDLDGTFFNNDGEVSAKSKDIINRLSADGLLFSVATARSVLSSVPLLEGVNVTAPIVAMSGVVIYDIQNKKTVKSFPIEADAYNELISVFEKHGKSPFSFFLNENGEYQIQFTDLKLEIHKLYYETRTKIEGTNLRKVKRYETPDGFSPIFVSLCDEYDDLVKIKAEIDGIAALSCSFYKDTYTKYWFLEVFDANVSKANGLKIVKEYTHAERVVAFGDNRNDFPLFDAADVKCAVDNAVDELKEKADIIIGSNETDGVVRFIMSDYSGKGVKHARKKGKKI